MGNRKEILSEVLRAVHSKVDQLPGKLARLRDQAIENLLYDGPYVYHDSNCPANGRYEKLDYPSGVSGGGAGGIPMALRPYDRCIDCGAEGYPLYLREDVTREAGVEKRVERIFRKEAR